MLQKYEISLHHKDGDAKDIISGDNLWAHDAVVAFMQIHFPDKTFYSPLRWEQPIKGKNNSIHEMWSCATNASGQRIWIEKL